MDEENLFSSKEDVYGNMLERHENYNYENRINDYTDFILEREFRKKVEEFLCDGKIKLFKSTPEGSMLVRLMNVSLTPEKALGRMLYSFSATAYEIADLTIKNINDYEIQDIGTLLDIPSGVYEKYLQLKIDNFGEYVTDKTGAVKNQDVFEAIAQHEKDNQDNPIYKVKATKIKKLKISFEGEPYRIYYKSSKTQTNPADGFFANPEEVNLNREKFFQETSEGLDAGEHWTDYQQVLGYLFAFVGNKDTIIQKFFVPYRYTENERGEFLGYGEYTMQGDNPLLNTDTVKIVGLVPREKEGGIPVLLDCLAEIEEYHQTVTNPNAVSLYNKFGQVHNVFAPLDNPVSLIKEKGYYLERDSENRIVDQSYVYFINSIRVESEPFAVFYKRSNDINEYIRYVLGPGGYLTLEEEDFSIQELYFKGIYLPKISREKQSYNEVNEINNPKKDCVYTVKSLKNVYKPYNLNRVPLNSYTSTIEDLFDDKLSYYSVVFIDNTWWLFDEKDSVAIMPLYALVDYNYDLEVRHYEYSN
jgi:hypothetical protein